MNINFQISTTDILAIWGSITGTVGIMLAAFSYVRDRAVVKIKIKKDWILVDPDHSSAYKHEEKYTVISVINKGRRPVVIRSVGYVNLKKQGGGILSDSILSGERKIEEASSSDYHIEAKLLDWQSIDYFVAYDAIGRSYRCRIKPIFISWMYWPKRRIGECFRLKKAKK